MPSRCSLTRYQQSSYSRDSSSDSSYRLSSPSVELEAKVEADLEDFAPPHADLSDNSYTLLSLSPTPEALTGLRGSTPITTPRAPPSSLLCDLVFNRERVYQERSVSRTPGLAASFSIERGQSSVVLRAEPSRNLPTRFNSRPHDRVIIPQPDIYRDRDHMSVPKVGALPKVSRKKGRPPGSRTKSKTKSKEDPGPPYRPKRKRADSLGETFESKLKKLKTRPEANSGRKVGTSGSPASTKAITPDVIDLTDSDDEYKDSSPRYSMLRALQSQLRRSTRSTRTPSRLMAPVIRDTDRTLPMLKVDTIDSEPELQPSTTSHSFDQKNDAELQEVRREMKPTQDALKNAQDELRKLQQETEKRNADAQLEKQKIEATARQETAKLTRELEAERRTSHALAEERDRLRAELQRSNGEAAKYAKLVAAHEALQLRYNQEKEERKKDQQDQAEALEDIIKSKAAEVKVHDEAQCRLKTLETENARLTKENHTLKTTAATPSSFQPRVTSSPVPSQSSSTDEEWRVDNIRKVYSKIRLQYDILHSAANSLASCSRTMDLSSFGEFGKCMKKLRNALESENGQAKRKVEEEDGAAG